MATLVTGVGEEHVADGVTANYPRHLAIEGPTQEVQAWEHAWLWVSPGIILQFHSLGTRPLVGHICQAQGTDLPQHSWSSYQAAFQLFSYCFRLSSKSFLFII